MKPKIIKRASRTCTLRPANKLLFLLLLLSTMTLLFLKNTTVRMRKFKNKPLDLVSNSTMLLINGHAGTSLDFSRIASRLNISYHEISPRDFAPYGQSRAEADYLAKTIGLKICSAYQYVGVIDTNPDARFLLQLMIENKCNSIKKLLFITTNRFDFDIIDYWDYYNLIRKVGRTLEDKVMWVSNNPVSERLTQWEAKYTSMKLGGDYVKFEMIRPFGYSSLPPAPKPVDAHLPVVFNYGSHLFLIDR